MDEANLFLQFIVSNISEQSTLKINKNEKYIIIIPTL